MFFLIAYLLIATSCVLITARTLVAYNDVMLWGKIAVYTILIFAWVAPIFIWILQPLNVLQLVSYKWFAKCGYFLFGFAFILVVIILLRDLCWNVIYYISDKKFVSPHNVLVLKWANLITIAGTFFLSCFSLYEAEKMPRVLNYSFEDARIKEPVKILLVTDIHITKIVDANKIKRLVKYLNKLKPDIMLLAGDIGDDKVDDVSAQIKALGKLRAPLGIYYSSGNHESYFDAYQWEAAFASLGWRVLHNSGVNLSKEGIYIAGIPEIGRFPTNIKQALRQADENSYRILLSHLPTMIKVAKNENVDLQVSGHTHGGQIFPFNLLAKWGNEGYIFGKYLVDNTVLLVSRGVGYWGPPMRLFAPNDVIVIELKPKP